MQNTVIVAGPHGSATSYPGLGIRTVGLASDTMAQLLTKANQTARRRPCVETTRAMVLLAGVIEGRAREVAAAHDEALAGIVPVK